jgi:hypothetical protein
LILAEKTANANEKQQPEPSKAVVSFKKDFLKHEKTFY